MVSTVQSKPPSLTGSRSHPCLNFYFERINERRLGPEQPVFCTYLIFFFPSNRLRREATVRPAGRGGGATSGARERTWVTDGVSGGGLDGRPRALGVARAVVEFLPRRRGVASASGLLAEETAGRTDDASSWFGCVGARSKRRLADAPVWGPFRLGSSSAPGSPSWSESISVGTERPLDFFPDLADLGLSLDFCSAFPGSLVEPGGFCGDT
jgi:hypothetical protein